MSNSNIQNKQSTEKLVLTREQVRNCDRIAIEKYRVKGLVLMENAGAAAARLVQSLWKKCGGGRVCILAGAGNNGGDGYVVARQLYNAGIEIEVAVLAPRNRIQGDALTNLQIIELMGLPMVYLAESHAAVFKNALREKIETAGIIVDGLLGTGVAGPPREPIRTAINLLSQPIPGKIVIALDIPSGLDCDTGKPLEVAVRADHTVTFAALKKGFQNPESTPYTGEVTVASIGIDTRLLIK